MIKAATVTSGDGDVENDHWAHFFLLLIIFREKREEEKEKKNKD